MIVKVVVVVINCHRHSATVSVETVAVVFVIVAGVRRWDERKNNKCMDKQAWSKGSSDAGDSQGDDDRKLITAMATIQSGTIPNVASADKSIGKVPPATIAEPNHDHQHRYHDRHRHGTMSEWLATSLITSPQDIITVEHPLILESP